MESKKYIETLKKETHEVIVVAMRQALCYFLYQNDIPCTIIASTIGCSRWNVYLSIYRTRDLLEVGDKIMLQAYEEVKQHDIKVKPYTCDGNVLSKHMGYKLIIDNIII